MRCALFICAALGLQSLVLASPQIAANKSKQNQLIQEKLGLHTWSKQRMQLREQANATVTSEVVHEGKYYRVEWVRNSVRSPRFQVLVTAEDGSLKKYAPKPSRTYAGVAFDEQGREVGKGRATLRLDKGQMSAMLRTHDGQTISWQPLQKLDPTALADEHVVFESADMEPVLGFCAVTDTAIDMPGKDWQAPESTEAVTPTSVKAEIGLDLDSAYFNNANFGNGDVDTAVEDMEDLFNKVSGIEEIYFTDTGITYEITTIITRMGAAQDPYDDDGNLAGDLLDEIERIWNKVDRDEINIPRDVAHLMTGINMSGSTIGVAWLSGVCNQNTMFSVSQTTFTTNTAQRIALTAHELGHNWSAGHCDGNANCNIMCSGLGGCSGVIDQFGPNSITSITNFRDTRNCLQNGYDRVDPPFRENFENSSALNSEKWTWFNGNQISQLADNEPSGNNSLMLNAAGIGKYQDDEVRTIQLKMGQWQSQETTRGVFVNFFSQLKGLEVDETLEVEYYNNMRLWTPLLSIPQLGPDETVFTFHQIALPSADAFWQDFRLRFRSNVDEINDECFIDDVQVSLGGLALTSPVLKLGNNTVQVFGANPGETVELLGSFAGLGAGACMEDLCFEILGPTFSLGSAVADGNGVASFVLSVPNSIAGTGGFGGGADFLDPKATALLTVYAQAMILRQDIAHSVLSNPVVLSN